MASITTNKLRTLLYNHGVDLLNDTLKAVLVNATYTPSKADSFLSAITGGTSKELSGTGYTAGFGGSGRHTLASKAVTQDDTNNWSVLDAADPVWAAINAGTVAHIAIVATTLNGAATTSDADTPLLAVITLPSTITTNGGDYTGQFAAPSAGGVFYNG
jgi:hypothetical protein